MENRALSCKTYLCVHTRTHTHTHTYARTRAYAQAHARTHTHTHKYTRTRVRHTLMIIRTDGTALSHCAPISVLALSSYNSWYVSLFLCLSVLLSLCLAVSLSLCLSVLLSCCLSVFMPLCHYFSLSLLLLRETLFVSVAFERDSLCLC